MEVQDVDLRQDDEKQSQPTQYSALSAGKPMGLLGKEDPRKIQIIDVQERGGNALTKYLVYIIECQPSPQGVVTVARRYRDFVWLKDIVIKQYPAMFVPPLPPKKPLSRHNTDFIEERRADLQIFLNRLECIAPFSDNLAFSTFLSIPEVSFPDSKKEVSEKLAQTDAQVTYTLQNLYPDIHEEDLPPKADQDVPRLKEFLQRCESQLKDLHSCAISVFSKSHEAGQCAALLCENTANLYAAESEYCIPSPIDREDVREELEEYAATCKDENLNMLENWLSTCRREWQDVREFIELINRRDGVNNRYRKAFQRAEKWRQKQADGELSPKDTATSNNDFSMEKEMNEYQEIVTKIILRHEIKRVWRRKIKLYKDTVAKMVHMQLSSAQKMADVWSKFAERVSNRN